MRSIDIYCDESCPDFFTTSKSKEGKCLLIGGIKFPTEFAGSV